MKIVIVADAINKWNNSRQASEGYLSTSSPYPWIPPYIGKNFQITIEEGYEVSAKQDAVWIQS